MDENFKHKWGWAFLPLSTDSTNRQALIGIAHCYNEKCGLTITAAVNFPHHTGQTLEDRIIVPAFGCENPLEGL